MKEGEIYMLYKIEHQVNDKKENFYWLGKANDAVKEAEKLLDRDGRIGIITIWRRHSFLEGVFNHFMGIRYERNLAIVTKRKIGTYLWPGNM